MDRAFAVFQPLPDVGGVGVVRAVVVQGLHRAAVGMPAEDDVAYLQVHDGVSKLQKRYFGMQHMLSLIRVVGPRLPMLITASFRFLSAMV
jgi:hypothetical protein